MVTLRKYKKNYNKSLKKSENVTQLITEKKYIKN